MKRIANYLYLDAAGQLTFRLILSRLLQQRFPSAKREIRWSLEGLSEDDARHMACELAKQVHDLRYRLGVIKTAEGLYQALELIRSSIAPLAKQVAIRPTPSPHSSQIPCPVEDLSLALGRARFEQLRMMPTFVLKESDQYTLQVPLPDLLSAAYPLMLKTQVFELHTLESEEAKQRSLFILQGMAELNIRFEKHLERGEWLPLYQASFHLELIRRYLRPEHGLHFRHNPRWLALRPQDLRERDHQFLQALDAPDKQSQAQHVLHPAIGMPHLLDVTMPSLLREHYPQLPQLLTFDLHTKDLHEATLKSGFVLERFDWLTDLVEQGQQFGGGIPALNELRIHVEAIRARLQPDGDIPTPPSGSGPKGSPSNDKQDNWGLPSSHDEVDAANPLGALFKSGFEAAAAQSPGATITVQKLLERFRRDQELTGEWSHQGTRFLNCARLESVCELLGPQRPIQSITSEDFRNLRTVLLMYPRNRRQMKELNSVPIHVLIQKGGYEPIHAKTAKKYFDLGRAMFRFAFENEWIGRDVGEAIRLKEKTRVKSNRVRRAYTALELGRLFSGPVYTTDTVVPRWRMDNFKFWLPLLGLYTGSRLNELCQLTLEDIFQTPEGVWVMSHNLNHPHKLLKNISSQRDIPLHSVLLEKGFLEFLEQRKAESQSTTELLFPEMRADTRRAHSHFASRWFCGDPGRAGYLQQCGFPRLCGLSFHSLRHTFINQLRQTGVDQPRIQALTGHTNDTTTAEYGDDYRIEIKQQTVEMLRFKLELAHVDFARYSTLKKKSRMPGRPVAKPSKPAPHVHVPSKVPDTTHLAEWLTR